MRPEYLAYLAEFEAAASAPALPAQSEPPPVPVLAEVPKVRKVILPRYQEPEVNPVAVNLVAIVMGIAIVFVFAYLLPWLLFVLMLRVVMAVNRGGRRRRRGMW
jgi:hypothetical protein